MSDFPASTATPETKTPLSSLLHLWFMSTEPVDRRTYVLSVVALTVSRIALELVAYYLLFGNILDLAQYLNPLLSSRLHGASGGPLRLAMLALVEIPLLWIWASLSIRRSVDAGLGAYVGLLVFMPVVSWFVVAVLATVATRGSAAGQICDEGDSGWWLSLLGVALAGLLGLVAVMASVFGFGSYGLALFVATPLLQGFVVGYAAGRDGGGVGRAIALAILTLAITGMMLLSLALEGLVCIMMALPIAVATAFVGALIGYTLGRESRTRAVQLAGVMLMLPLLLGAEAQRVAPPLREVVSVVEIDAPPQTVWPLVVGFSELPPISEWVFRLGIAHPIRARIDGEGVGAVRYCEFSTGPFVEPITRWEQPHRLSFDVRSQPQPMHEWSPYQHVDAPHLLHTLRSKRGEFRLIPLAGGRTRLEGSTWYEIEMFPQFYWSMYSDALIHAIHQRVLSHIKERAEHAASPLAAAASIAPS